MNIGRPKNGNVIEFSARIANASMPTGANRHKPPKSNRWITKAPRPVTRYFDLMGPCRGDRYLAIELGIKLAREALEAGDRVFAERVMARIQELTGERVTKVG